MDREEDNASVSSISMDDVDEDTQEAFPVDSKSYKIIELIGQGPNTLVYKALCIPKNTNVAIKAFDLHHITADLDEVIRQAKDKFHSVLNHPNILNSHCTFPVDNKIWVVMPFIPAGSLQSIMSNSFPTGLPENCIAVILQQILNLLSFLHSNKILYRELKPGNILLDPKGDIQFASFGVSASISRLVSISSLPSRIPEISCSDGSYWVAPEVYSVKSKIWLFGILALELAQGRPPLSDIDQYLSPSMTKKINERICMHNYKSSSSSSCSDKKTFSESFKDLVMQCLEHDPGNRPTLEMLQKHSFIRGCESTATGFLAKNMFHDLPSLEDRFKLSKNRYSDNVGEEENEKMGQYRISAWRLDAENLKLCPIFSSESNPGHVSQNETEIFKARRRRRRLIKNRFWGKKVIEEKDEKKDEKGKGKMDEKDEKGKGKMDEKDEKGKGKVDEKDEKGKGKIDEDREKEIRDRMWKILIVRIKDVIFGLDRTGEQLDEMDETKTKEEVLTNLISSRSILEKQLHEIISLIDFHDQV